MGVIRSVLFFGSFLIARVPVWFIIAASLVNGFIKPEPAAALIAGIVICRSYLESEIAGSGFFLFTGLRIYRFFACLFGIAAVYAVFLYFALAADPLSRALIALALIITVYLYYGGKNTKERGYWTGYGTPLRVSVITSLLWLYLSFVPDTLFGNMSVLCAIYIIEFVNLFKGTPLQGLGKIIRTGNHTV